MKEINIQNWKEGKSGLQGGWGGSLISKIVFLKSTANLHGID